VEEYRSISRNSELKKETTKMKRQILTATMFLFAVALLPRMSFAHNIASGCGSRNDIAVSDENNFATLCSTRLTLTDGRHQCVATASAEAANPGGVDNLYRFTIDIDSNPVTNSAFERTIELDDNSGISDPDAVVVSTVRHFNLASGTYTFYWLARPLDSSDATVTIEDYSMGVVCVDGN
jgi:hypothetical protein